MNPCGAAIGRDVVDAWTKAYEADTVSIFGGIVATNCEVNAEAAALMKPIFLEIIMAPSFTPEALEILCTKKNLRLLQVDMKEDGVVRKQYVSVTGGMLVQDQDLKTKVLEPEMCVTAVKPTAAQMTDMQFAWRIVKHVKSNAIVVVKDGATLGVGAGQMNRVGSARIALEEAKAALAGKGVDICGAGVVLGSDGFFPFGDTVSLAAQYGVAAIVQPGGSVRDEESVAEADKQGITMLFTGMRHFKH
jgi:phosphoribosylaminoimidazolecarboxamide formyltransferase/IMP cyclohydrolase